MASPRQQMHSRSLLGFSAWQSAGAGLTVVVVLCFVTWHWVVTARHAFSHSASDASKSDGKHATKLGFVQQTISMHPKEASVSMDSPGEPPVEMLWQRPLSTPVGVLLLAHGCKHQATDFWPTSVCSRCLGLPEELEIVRTALARNVLPVAITSKDRKTGCWREEDISRVEIAIAHLYKVEGLDAKFPLYAFGASSGGRFVGSLARSEVIAPSKLRCRIPQIMGIDDEVAFTGPGGISWQAPPTLFIHMAERDRHTAASVA